MTTGRLMSMSLLLCSLVLTPVQALPAAPPASTARAAMSDYDRGIRLLCRAGGRRAVQAEAARWLRQAAQQGHAGAQSVLGWMHLTGIGVTRDDAAAARWQLQLFSAMETYVSTVSCVIVKRARGRAPDSHVGVRTKR